MNLLLAITSAILLALAFPKTDLSILTWLALVPFLAAIEKCRNEKQALVIGAAFGLVFFGINLFWVNILYHYVGFFAHLGWFSLILFQAIFPALFAYFSKKLRIGLTLWQALLWSIIEFIRGSGPFGVAGGMLAYSQAGYLPLIQIASIVSVYGISFLIVFFNLSLARIIIKRDLPAGRHGWRYFAAVILLLALALFYGEIEINKEIKYNKEITVSIIQPNIPQEKKLDARYNAENFDTLAQLTEMAGQEHPDVIIWPETALFTYMLNDRYYLDKFTELIKKQKAEFLIGSPHYDADGNIYNSILAFSKEGRLTGRYDKEHLVPFGEYLPFKAITYQILKSTDFFGRDFSAGKITSPVKLDGVNIGSVICFESTFPLLVKQRAKGSDLLLVVTNDAWFKDTSAPYEHFGHAVFRAIENRKYFIQAANTGISGLIDPKGRIVKKLDLNNQGFLTFKVPLP